MNVSAHWHISVSAAQIAPQIVLKCQGLFFGKVWDVVVIDTNLRDLKICDFRVSILLATAIELEKNHINIGHHDGTGTNCEPRFAHRDKVADMVVAGFGGPRQELRVCGLGSPPPEKYHGNLPTGRQLDCFMNATVFCRYRVSFGQDIQRKI
jgi:hypothetical protein